MEISIDGISFLFSVREESEDLIDNDEGWESDGVLDSDYEPSDLEIEMTGSMVGDEEDRDVVMVEAGLADEEDDMGVRQLWEAGG